MKNNLNKKRGFTLIELLVVISIISLLSTVVLGALGESKVKAEYKRFAQDLDSFQKAMQLYYQDNNTYPLVDTVTTPLSDVTEVLVNENYLAGDLSYVNNTDANNNTHYVQNSDYIIGSDTLTCGSENEISNNKSDYTLFIYDDDVDYTENISSRFKNAYSGATLVPNTYCIHY